MNNSITINPDPEGNTCGGNTCYGVEIVSLPSGITLNCVNFNNNIQTGDYSDKFKIEVYEHPEGVVNLNVI